MSSLASLILFLVQSPVEVPLAPSAPTELLRALSANISAPNAQPTADGVIAIKPTCRLQPKLNESMEIDGRSFDLAIFDVERQWQGLWIGADVITVLSRESGAASWIRTGPWIDTKWQSLVLPQSKEWLEYSTSSPFRSCFAQIAEESEAVDIQMLAQNNQLFLILEEAADGVLALRPAYSQRRLEELGPDRLRAWFQAQEFDLAAATRSELAAVGPILPASSAEVWRESLYPVGQPYPLRQIEYTPCQANLLLPEIEVQRQGPAAEEARRAIKLVPDAANESTVAPCSASCSTSIRIPRAEAADFGFFWDWAPLCDAEVANLGLVTDHCGCLEREADQKFQIFLRNAKVTITDSSGTPFDLWFKPKNPFVFLNAGGRFKESLAAGNAFVWANEAIVELGRLYEWLPRLVKDVELRLVHAVKGECAANRARPRQILLPQSCPEMDGFVPKGLCGDVVIHELAHELMGNLVGLSNGGQFHRVGDSVLNEALADFFAMTLRRPGLSRDSEYGKNCLNDYKDIDLMTRNGHKGQNPLLRGLRGQEETERELLAKLAVIAILHGSDNWQVFLDEILDLAIDKVGIGKEKVTELCNSLEEHTGFFGEACRPPMPSTEGREAPVAPKISAGGADFSATIVDWNQISPEETGVFLVKHNGQLASLDGTETPAALSRGILPGISVSRGDTIEGWMKTGAPFRTFRDAQTNALKARSGERAKILWKPGSLPPGGGRILQENPRLEILEVDPRGLTVVSWSTPIPVVSRGEWQAIIDPDTFEAGFTPDGKAVVWARVNATRELFSYSFNGGVMKRIDIGFAVIPVERPGIKIRRANEKDITVEIDGSVCRAPPFLRFHDQDKLLVLTCDGVVADIDLAKQPPSVDWFTEPFGIVAPDRNIQPILVGDLDGDTNPEWIVGPFRKVVDGKISDKFVTLTSTGEEFEEPIVVAETIGSAITIDSEQDGCWEVNYATKVKIIPWRSKKPCGLQ